MTTNEKTHGGQAAIAQEEHMPEALFVNLETRKIESLRPDRITEPEQYLLLSDLLAK